MVTGSATFAANAAQAPEEAGAYSNQTYLESQASAAYNETGLGSTYSKTSTTWKTWSPDATSVKLKLYSKGSDTEAGAKVLGEHAMTKNNTTGIWSITLQGDYKNVYYTYIVNAKGKTNETQDVYSKATGVNGRRSMVVDLDSTDPDGWSTDKHVLFNGAQEAVVWEVHIRDFSISATSGVSEDNKGRYLGFTEGGTTLSGKAGQPSTAVDYLVESGINCVQIMPSYDFGSVDEAKGASSTNRNWGYDPVNYNVPEGSYSSNPYDGNVRIKEYKQMIQALHDRGISVVMDVVYNHTYSSTGSCFEMTAPGYYFRMNGSAFSNGSGCGNETASDKKMYRKYMIESCKYWAEEYHIDGFRFDLMGLHDVTTMNQIRSELDGITASMQSGKSGKQILMYGEAWTGGTTLNPEAIYSYQGTGLSRLDSRVGAFGDRFRDSLRGNNDCTVKGYLQGDTTKTNNIVLGVQGKVYEAASPKSPAQALVYGDCHDNLILWDQLTKNGGSTAYTGTALATQSQVKMAMALMLTAQGIPFMTAGSEFGRTKKGDHNSYNSSDDINQIDWNRTKNLSALANYYKGLLQIRKNYSPLKGSTFSTPTFTSNYGNVVGYTYSNSKSGEWNKLAVLVNNSSSSSYSINIGGSSWTVVANGTSAGLKSLGTSGSSYSIGPRSVAILVDSASFGNLKVDETFGTLTVKHVDSKGNVLKTSSAKYRAGSTYRALPDTTLLFDYNLTKTEGTTTGTVQAGGTYNVTFTYSDSGVPSGYVNVSYVDSTGKEIKPAEKTKYKAGSEYSVPFVPITGYQLDTTKYPAKTKGTFTGDDINIKFVYKPLSTTTTTVHYYNSNNWSNVICYGYTDDGEVTGKWDTSPVMSSEGNGWLKATINSPTVYVMFHPKTGTGQEPGENQPGYLVSGEAWIQNQVVSFGSTVVTSHIDIATGAQISADVTNTKTKVANTETYTTSALAGRTDVVVPSNATGNYAAGVVNVVYLYGGGGDTPTEPTTEATTPTNTDPTNTEPTETKPTDPTVTDPTVPTEKVLIGDADQDGFIKIGDATAIQRHLSRIVLLSELGVIAADCNGDGQVTIKDATLIQKYLASYKDHGNVGLYTGETNPTVTQPAPTDPPTPPTDPLPTDPEPTDAPYTDPVPDNRVTLDGTFCEENGGAANWYAWTWGADGEGEWVSADADSTDVAHIYFSNLKENVIFVRVNPEATEPSWDDGVKWNQTNDLTVDGTTYTITGWGSGWGANLDGAWS